MADPRQWVGVRLSPAGVDYAKHVAARDHITFSEAIRRLLSLGARADKDTHDPQQRQPESDRAGSSARTGHVRPDDSNSRDRDGDGSSQRVPDLPASGPGADGPASEPGGTPRSIGDAIAVLHYAGLAPATVNDEPRSA